MSWIQQKTLPPLSSSSANASSSSILLSTSHSSLNTNNTIYNTTNRNVNPLRQACQPILNAAQQSSDTLLMTSQYSNQANTLSKTPPTTAMRVNPNSAYQPSLTPQQLHQQQPMPHQRHHQEQSNSLQQPISHVPPQMTTANSNASHLQGAFDSSCQQQNSWPTQQPGYFAPTKMMPPTPAPPTVSAATATATTSWPQQPPQQVQQNLQNVNMYQQNMTAQQQQLWPQKPNQISSYDNYYQQQPQQQQQPATKNIYQQQQPQIEQQKQHTYFQQQPTQSIQSTQVNPVNYFDQSNNNNNNSTASADSWSDWDWNENSTITAQPGPADQVINKPETNAHALQAVQSINQQHQPVNSVLAESFSTENNNDSWSWGSNENEQQLSHKETQNNNWTWNHEASDKEKIQQQQLAACVPPANEPHNDKWNWQSTNENQQLVSAAQNMPEMNKITTQTKQIDSSTSSPPPPPPTEFSSLSASENHNYNTNASATQPNNIPNTVFVTQAKPVTLPSRQYASPPSGNTPVAENPTETAIMPPPQGFQNNEDSYHQSPGAVVTSPPLPTSLLATPSLANVPPSTVLPPTSNKTGNPFKRSGVAQHHRATGILATTASSGQIPEPTAFNMPPPPPADFANPGAITLMEPDNNELPSQENQEVVTPATTQITLPNTTIQSSAGISVPTNILMQAPPPPNDERNQYLQTSHLSENSEEQQPEVDGLLPPPGLSRLVLGEPELEASQQRMVMGIEAPNAINNMNQAAVMHLEERHADGEDTASENAIPVTSSAGQGVPTTSSSMSSDRNLYMVPGESNVASGNQQQRVVTGVELAEQREIEMDGENLEDEQIQHPGACLSAEARNEPPVEGADDTVAAPTTSAAINTSHATDLHLEQQNHHKTKDSNNISSPNDEDDSDEQQRLLNDRGMNQSTAGSSKSRTKYEIERLSSAARRRDKRSSAERYESDEYLNSDGEYSSEREERERRDRSDRRRNYREGSVRSDRGLNEEDEKRSRRHRVANKRDKYYYDGDERSRGGRDERERDHDRDRDRDRERDKGLERSKPERRSQRKAGYDADSRYETEESTRFDSRKDTFRRGMRHNDRGDQAADYDDYNRRGAYRSSKRSVDNYDSDRRDRRRSEKHREPRFREDPRYDPREYEDYRKHSSRNARESDMEKEGAVTSRSGRSHHDPRHAAASAMYGYPSGGYYDPYTAYYYQQMARTNPQAYAEWYKKYYGQAASSVTQGASLQGAPNAGQADLSLQSAANDGRESVHSGRSSAHNDIKDRYTHAYITQANDYHRHYQHQQQQQQHLHQQHFHQQQQQQMAFNKSLNSTMFDEESLNHNTSIYSGLGSLSLARSNTNLSQIHGGYYMPATTAASTTAGVYYARSDYAESRSGGISLRDSEPISQEPQRLTPCKFITEHTVVNFASGILVTVKPKYTPNGNISNIVKLLKFKPNDETRKLFKAFPGPLVRGLSHKKTIIEFCQEQIRLGPLETTIYAKQLIINNEEKYRGSYTLMWNLLILLLKQNGMVVGTDIAELLLKNQQQFPYQTTTQDSFESKSGSNSPTADVDLSKDPEETNNLEQQTLTAASEKLQENNDAENNSLAKSSNSSMSLTEAEITEKFRNYLLYGNVNEALEWATDNNLWGHALFLASKLDRRSHANVMMKFANKLSLNDPLQTLYQLMSGRTPSSVTCVQDEKWGDWRPHLSMILSNTSQKPELDRKAITSLGDSLFNRGDLYAAQFCYLMAQVNFGRYQETATHETSLQQHLPKLVLLGASHCKQFKDFAQNEAIIMTEIYEYACSLNDDKFSIVEFQPYKFLLATRLLDYGFHLKSLMYLEQAAGHIARDPSKYESSFINKVYEMADRLKYYDPALEKTIDDQQLGSDDNNALNLTPQQMEEQKWLQNLRQLAQQYQNVYNNASSSAVLTAGVQDCQVQSQLQEPCYYNQQQQIDQQFMEINKQFSELNLQYQQATTEGNNEQQQQHQHQQQQQIQEQPALDLYQKQEPQQSLQTEVLNQNVNNNLQQPVESQLGETLQNVYQQQPQYLQPEVNPTQSTGYNTSYPSQYNTVDAGNSNLNNQQQANYDYWSQQQHHQQQSLMPQITEENVRPTISMPKTKTYDTDDDNLAKTQQQQQQVNKRQQQQAQQQQQKAAKKEDANKNQQQSNQNSGWFGGIWNKFSLKPKNQMILPDDKNPAIVWDPEKKKWVNTDGDGDEQEALKPPPKMTDLMPQQHSQQSQNLPQQQPTQTNQIPFMDPQQMMQQQQQTQLQQFVPNSITQSTPSPNPLQQQQNLNQSQSQVPGPAKTPTLQSNMFKMQRNRTLKNAYVDVFNPSGAPVNKAAENILAPALPPATVPQSGFLIPGSMPANAGSSEEQQYQLQQHQQQQPQQQDTPQFYNPNQFTSGTGY